MYYIWTPRAQRTKHLLPLRIYVLLVACDLCWLRALSDTLAGWTGTKSAL